jgi:hypothetical protein
MILSTRTAILATGHADGRVIISASLIVRVCADLNKEARSWSQHLASASLERSSWSSSSSWRSGSPCAAAEIGT